VPITHHWPIYHNLIAWMHDDDIAYHHFSRINLLLASVAQHHCFGTGKQSAVVKRMLRPYFLNEADDHVERDRADRDQRIEILIIPGEPERAR